MSEMTTAQAEAILDQPLGTTDHAGFLRIIEARLLLLDGQTDRAERECRLAAIDRDMRGLPADDS